MGMGRENVLTKSQHKNCKQIGKNKKEINTFILSVSPKKKFTSRYKNILEGRMTMKMTK